MKKLANFGKSIRAKSEEDLSLDQDFIYDCKVVYLTVLSGLDERITSPEELTLLLQYAGKNPSSRTIEKHWNKKTGYLTFQQFCEIVHKEPSTKRDQLLDAFRKIDVNGDGYLSHNELSKLLTTRGDAMSKRELQQILDDADYNGDGKLDYQEFCNFMTSTIKKCKEKHRSTSNSGSSYLSRMSKKQHTDIDSGRDDDSDVHSGSPKQSSLRKSLQRKGKIKKQKEPLVEPDDLMKWNYKYFKGYLFYDDDTVKCHQYNIRVTRDTLAWIGIQSVKPKYGQFDETILLSDLTAIILQNGDDKKMVEFTSTIIDGKSCMKCQLKAGNYTIVVFSSGAILKHTSGSSKASKHSKSLQPKLAKGEGDSMRLSRACRDALMEIFYRCDINGDGYLSRDEFNYFQLQTSGEECDDDAWEVVKENFEMNNQMELTVDGFLTLNLLEAKDPDGNGPEDLWVTLEAMGYSETLNLTKACPYQLEVFMQRCDVMARMEVVNDVARQHQDALLQCITTSEMDDGLAVDGNEDVRLYTWKSPMCTTLAVKNLGLSPIRVRIDCSQSLNALTSRSSLDTTMEVRPHKLQIAHHLVALDQDKSMNMHCRAMLVQ